jgi:predicted lactoylglutathione lyase
MIGYITLGTNDVAKAAEFYDQLLETIGAGRFMESDTYVAWAKSPESPALSIIKPFDGEVATMGNGVMISLQLDSPEQVANFHAKALSLGGTDEGAPGPRGEGSFYIGYFRDLDGNKLAAYTMAK